MPGNREVLIISILINIKIINFNINIHNNAIINNHININNDKIMTGDWEARRAKNWLLWQVKIQPKMGEYTMTHPLLFSYTFIHMCFHFNLHLLLFSYAFTYIHFRFPTLSLSITYAFTFIYIHLAFLHFHTHPQLSYTFTFTLPPIGGSHLRKLCLGPF